MQTRTVKNPRWAAIPRFLVGLLLVGAVLVLVVAALLAAWTARQPFLGLFAEPTLIVNGIGDPTWSGRAAGLHIPDQLVALNGRPLSSTTDLSRELTHYAIGDTVTVRARDAATGAGRDVQVELIALPHAALRDYFLVPYGLAWVYLLVGIWIYLTRRDEEAGLVLAVFCAFFALLMGLMLDLYITHWLYVLWVAAAPLLGSTILHLGLIFPQRPRVIERWPFLRLLVYLPGLALVFIGVKETLNWIEPIAYFGPWAWGRAWGGIGALAMIGIVAYRRYLSDSPIVQTQARTVLWGAILSFTPLILWTFTAFRAGVPLYPLLFFPPLILFPISIAYVLLRYRLPDIDWVLRQGLVYATLSLLVVGGYFLLLFLIGVIFRATVMPDNPVVLALFVLLIALLLHPARLALQRLVSRLLLGRRLTYEEALNEFSRQVMVTVRPDDVFEALGGTIRAALGAVQVIFFTYDQRKGQYVPTALSNTSAPAVAFRRDGALASLMLQESSPLFVYPDRVLPIALAWERELIEAVGASLYIPLPGYGWLALGTLLGRRRFRSEDLHFLEALAAQAATALGRVQLVADLQRRLTQLETLRFIAQAASYSVEFDDLLELIHAQTSRVMDATNFYIALRAPETRTLRFAIYVENGERSYPDDEWPDTEGLSGVIVQTGQPLVTTDYLSECARRNIQPSGKPGKAWMGMPLISRDQVIGVMNVSSFDPEVTYSEEQVELFRAIADQAAGVLDKVRLYREMEERAHELETLNEVGSAISSTLELEAVLNLIVQKAVELIRAEGGSLFLLDEETGEMVFHVASLSELIGMRLPKGAGIVGQVAEQGRPIIVDDVRRDGRWFSGVQEKSGVVTRSLIAVPMSSRGRLIGVLELINRRDGKPFNAQDRDLLMAFAANAAVAIENARLFTMTDQALARRVEELSTMQRIDRELNVTLDYRKVMDITLEWALKVTGADIGLLAAVVETEEGERGLHFLANRGYPDELVSAHSERPWPIHRGLIGRVARTGKAELVEEVSQDPDYVSSVPGMTTQLTVPILREQRIVGAIALESSQPGRFAQEAVDFVTRLADHAAIAMENARLFEAVQAANNAKTEFISFVSHELKQPMTSIKGYTDLLVKGTAGELSEMQLSFLEVIRSNIARMDSLVQDLLDVSRIEAGRLKLDIGRVEMAEVIEDAVRGVRRQVEAKGQELDIAVPRTLPSVLADRNRLVQVLVNLLSNAYKYTPEGGQIRVIAEAEDGEFVRCSVADTGIGMTPEEQERLFTKYFRSNNPAVRNVPGTGLGLVITKSLVELQGGNIWVESEPGRGSTFTFTVPVVT